MEFKKGKKVRVVRDTNNYLKGWGRKQVPFEAVMSNLRTDDDGYYLFDDTISRLVIRLTDCEEIELTLEEVREHFKDAKEVRCLWDSAICDYKDDLFKNYKGEFWDNGSALTYRDGKFAEIVSYKSEGVDEEFKEVTKEGVSSYFKTKDEVALNSAIDEFNFKYPQDRPKHYKSREVNGMDVIDLGEHWRLNFQETNILKHLLRDKGEDEQDMVKIADYAKRELEFIKQRKNK